MPERVLVLFPVWRQSAVASNHWGGEGQSGFCIRYIIYLCSSFLPISVLPVQMGCIPLEPPPRRRPLNACRPFTLDRYAISMEPKSPVQVAPAASATPDLPTLFSLGAVPEPT